ncbi:hypothetical protein [Modestobacter lapidis]|nr:hypothetical protein [Modestobacter lapidis]
MTSTTGFQPGSSIPLITISLNWSPMSRLRRTAAGTATMVRRSLTAARDYESAQGPSARHTVLQRFATEIR